MVNPKRRGVEVHRSQATCGSLTGASRFLIALVTCFARYEASPLSRAPGSRLEIRGHPGKYVNGRLVLLG